MKAYLPAEELTLVHSGRNYFEVLEKMIAESRETLYLHTYIFLADETGLRVKEALKSAAKRGVKVYVLADAFGSNPLPRKEIRDMQEAGVHIRLFSPLFSSESIYFGRRLHHKIVVADKTLALTGGINIADKYNLVGEEQPWLDYALLARSEACEYLHLLCSQLYHKRGTAFLKEWEKRHPGNRQPNPSLLRYGRNDWIKRTDEVHQGYMQALVNAKHSITIVGSYFLPGQHFRSLLRKASARGVRVRVILARKLDSTTLRLAESYLYDFYIRHNIDLYEWRNSVLHGKAMVVDEEWATIGSYNVNYLSHYLSIELNADVMDKAFAQHFTDHLDDICENHCNFMNSEKNLQKRTVAWRFGMWLAYNFHRLVQNFMMTGRRHRERKTKK